MWGYDRRGDITTEEVQRYVKKYEEAMEDDFNTADAIAAIFELVKFANTHGNGDSSKAFVQYLFDTIVKLSDVLGLLVDKEEEMLDEDVEKLIAERQAARKEKNSNGQMRSEISWRLGNHSERYERRRAMEKSLEYFRELFGLEAPDIRTYSPLTPGLYRRPQL